MIKTCLIITTARDFSLPLFFDVSTLKTTLAQYGQIVPSGPFDFIYLRDPFNDPELTQEEINYTFDQLGSLKPNSYMVDGAANFDDLLIEDKWRQYQHFSDLMAKTSLLTSKILDGAVIKKRISARSKAVYFSAAALPDGVEPSDYIVQEKLNIEKEYRVYMIGREISVPMAVRSSKTETVRAKIIGVEDNLPAEIEAICAQVYDKLGFDFVGLDIARVGKDYKLIEVNRSPQFRGYQRLSQVNMAAKLYDHLVKTLDKSEKKL